MRPAEHVERRAGTDRNAKRKSKAARSDADFQTEPLVWVGSPHGEKLRVLSGLVAHEPLVAPVRMDLKECYAGHGESIILAYPVYTHTH